MKLTAVIVDDEERSRKVLKSLLKSFFPEFEILGEAANVEDAHKLITEKKPRLVFLDIQMPRANGFSLLKKYDQVPFEVIFVTSYDKYAINAIKFNALDYLLKPVEIKELKKAMARVVRHITYKGSTQVQIINLLSDLQSDPNEYKVAVHSGEQVKFINQKDILYIEANGSYCALTVDGEEKFTTARTLKDFEEYFGEHSFFVRVHRSYLLNVKHIRSYSKGEPCILQMTNGKSFEVSRRKKTEILDKLKDK